VGGQRVATQRWVRGRCRPPQPPGERLPDGTHGWRTRIRGAEARVAVGVLTGTRPGGRFEKRNMQAGYIITNTGGARRLAAAGLALTRR